MTKIYTKRGDEGQTDLLGGVRVSKDDLRIRVYGTVDELNAVVGFASSQPIAEPLTAHLLRIQGELFQIGTELATPRGKSLLIAGLEDAATETLEREIDAMEKGLAPLKNFILPGGAPGAAALHVARTVCRRMERELMGLNRAESVRPVLLRYVNRLSDYFFVAARWANHQAGVADVPWKAPRTS